MNITWEKGKINIEPYSAYSGVQGSSDLGKINFPYEVPFQQAKQMDDDAKAIKNNQPMMVPGEEGLRDIKVVQAIYKCAGSGMAVEV